MGRKVSIDNLAPEVDQVQLRELFSEHGTVDTVRIIKDVKTGESVGSAIVEMGSRHDAKAAVEALDGTEYKGKELSVAEIGSGGSNSGFSGGRPNRGRSTGRNSRIGFGGTLHSGKSRGRDR